MKRLIAPLILIPLVAFAVVGPFPGGSSGGGSGTVTGVTASSPLSSSGGTAPDISCQAASGSQAGCLSSANWTTFNSSLRLDGSNAMTGALPAAVGTSALPGYTFNGDTNTGMSAATADTLILSTSGAARQTIRSDGTMSLATATATTSSDGYLFNSSGLDGGGSGIHVNDKRGNTGVPDGSIWIEGSRAGGSGYTGMRMNLTGSTTSYSIGSYIISNISSPTFSFAPFTGSVANIGSYTNVSAASDTGTTTGHTGVAYDSKGVSGGNFLGVNPRDVSSAVSYGSRNFASGLTGSTNPIQRVGVYGWIAPSTTSSSSALEGRSPGLSAAAVFDNTTGTDNIMTLLDNGSSVFQVQDGGVTVIGGNAGSAVHEINGGTVAAAASVGTMTNFPTSGNPSVFLKVRINGVQVYIPAWTAP